MKGLISGIKRNSVHDGPGIRTTVFLKGCPLKCIWCHNPESISFSKEIGYYKNKCISCGCCEDVCPIKAVKMDGGFPKTDLSVCSHCFICTESCPSEARIAYGEYWDSADLVEKLLEDRDFYVSSGGGVTLSGGECLSQPDFAVEVARMLFSRNISVDIDTCGYVPREVFDSIIPYADLFLYDIKAMDPVIHRKCTGRDNKLILDNLKYLAERNCRIEIRYPYVPGWNDMESAAICRYLRHLPDISKVKILGYHKMAGGKYEALSMPDTLPDTQPTPADIDKVVSMFAKYNINAVNGMIND